MKTLPKPITTKASTSRKKVGKKKKTKKISSGNKNLDEAIKTLFGSKKD